MIFRTRGERSTSKPTRRFDAHDSKDSKESSRFASRLKKIDSKPVE